MSNINKADIVRLVAIKTDLSQRIVAPVVNAVFSSIIECTDRGHTVNVNCFGKFQKKHRAARTGRNPNTGEAIPIAECDKLMFTASK